MTERFSHFSQAVFLIGHCWNKLAAEELKKQGLKGSWALYLVTLYRADGQMTSAQLSEQCGRDKADTSRAIAAMEEKGILSRSGEKNYRAKLHLTPLGREIVGQLNERAELAVELAGEGLSEADRKAFQTALGVVAENLRRMSQEGLPE